MLEKNNEDALETPTEGDPRASEVDTGYEEAVLSQVAAAAEVGQDDATKSKIAELSRSLQGKDGISAPESQESEESAYEQELSTTENPSDFLFALKSMKEAGEEIHDPTAGKYPVTDDLYNTVLDLKLDAGEAIGQLRPGFSQNAARKMLEEVINKAGNLPPKIQTEFTRVVLGNYNKRVKEVFPSE